MTIKKDCIYIEWYNLVKLNHNNPHQQLAIMGKVNIVYHQIKLDKKTDSKRNTITILI